MPRSRTPRLAVLLAATLALSAAAVGGSAEEAEAAVSAPSFTGTVHAGGDDWDAFTVHVPAGTDLTATVSWDGAANLNAFVYSPSGQLRTMGGGARPEVARHRADVGGSWRFGVKALSGTSSYTMTVRLDTGPEVAASAVGGAKFWAIEQEAGNHRWSAAEAEAHARRFDRISALPGSYRGLVAGMKRANPRLLLTGYMQGAFAQAGEGTAYPEAWYLRDGAGNKIRNDFNLWMMDVANPAWIATRVEACRAVIRDSGYDGCFVDNLGAGTLAQSLTGQPINRTTGRRFTDAEWLRATGGIARSVSAGVQPAPVVVNGLVRGDSYFGAGAKTLLTQADSAMAETFVRTSRMGVDQYRTVTSWKADVDMLVDAAAVGKPVVAVTKVWAPASAAQEERWLRYSLGTFLLGTDGTSSFSFSAGQGDRTMDRFGTWDAAAALGAPTERYRAAGAAYKRAFSRGTVAVNPTGAAVTVPLGAAHRTQEGQVVATITLAAHTGALLVRV